MRYDPFRPDPLAELRQPRADRPALGLVDEDDALLQRRMPGWLRALAALIAFGFALSTALAAAATGGAWSPLTDEANPRTLRPAPGH